MLHAPSNNSPKSRLNKVPKPSHCPEKKGHEQFPTHNKRRFIPHPGEFPISYRRAECVRSSLSTLVENPFVGLSFQSNQAMDCGTILDVTITVGWENHTFQGQVCWVRNLDESYELGLCFAHEEDAFRARNLEQVCHIEIYRRRLCAISGCEIDIDLAAREWIERFSAQFPKLVAGI